MLLAATSSNWNQKTKYKKPKNRINSTSFRISTARELKFVCAQLGSRKLCWAPRVRANQQRSGASQQRATEKLLTVRSACARELARRGRSNRESRLVASR
jgi:hypothetical protein